LLMFVRAQFPKYAAAVVLLSSLHFEQPCTVIVGAARWERTFQLLEIH